MWTDNGFVVRFPDTEEPPDVSLLVPPADEAEHLVVGEIGATAFFAARFREAAGRALLLPRRRAGTRAPLWQQQKRASDLLAVASQYGSFPIVLETYRECLRDDFDIPALVDVLHQVAVEHAAQYRDALGIALPPGLPVSLLGEIERPLDELALRFARTHGPFDTRAFVARYHVSAASGEEAFTRLASRGRLIDGSFRPSGTGREWCGPDALRLARQRSLAKLRREAAPGDLDALASAGEIVWVGVEPLGQRDGRVALYLTDHLPRLARPRTPGQAPFEGPLAERMSSILVALRGQGASFFAVVHEASGGGYPGETLDALWALVWQGLVTNDTFQALRRYVRPPERTGRSGSHGTPFRSRRLAPPSGEGRWAIIPNRTPDVTPTAWATALADQLLSRHGVLTREAAASENIPGSFGTVYSVLRAMEESGRIRRGYFVAGVAATQFARPAAVDLLRSLRSRPDDPHALWLASTDPANPYGLMLKWPASVAGEHDAIVPAFARTVSTSVVLVDGALAAFLRMGNPDIGVFLPEAEPDRSRVARALASELAVIAAVGEGRHGGLLVGTINGRPASQHEFARSLEEAGFAASAMGYYRPRNRGRGSEPEAATAATVGRARRARQGAQRPPGSPRTRG